MIKCRRMTKYEQAMRPQSAASRQEAEMMNKSKRDAAVSKDPIEKIRLLCLSRGVTGILEFGRNFKKIANSLSYDDLAAGLKNSGYEIDDIEIKEFFDKFQTDESNCIHLNDIMAAIVPKLVEPRYKTVSDAFDKLDKENQGAITIASLRGIYSVSKNTKFLSGEESEEEIKQKLFTIFEGGTEEGKITKDEFFHYYSGISASIESDIHFDLMMRHAYKL